jgi:uncharacterized RDD family membrane protein YckC
MTKVSPIPQEARPYQGLEAGLVTRAIAGALDVIVAVVATVALYLGISGAMLVIRPRSFHFPDLPFLLGLSGVLTILVLYLATAWTLSGRSYGAHVMGIRILGRRGRHVRAPVALVRAVLYVVFPIGLLWCLVNPRQRSLQDVLLGTSVVYDWMPHMPAVAPPHLAPEDEAV